MLLWILIVVVFVMYRYIGALLYQRNNLSSSYDTGRASYPDAPSALAFLIDKYITKGMANRIRMRAYSFECQSIKMYRRFIFRAYKEIYFWPWYNLKELYVIWIFEWNFYFIRIKEKEKTKSMAE